jgi:Cu(I)/Ag(I) efflux system membrane fusion protein
MKKTIFLFAAVALMVAVSACSNANTSAHHPDETAVSTEVQNQDTHAALQVQGVCEMCKERIEKAAKEVPGVSSASWDSETKELHLYFNSDKTNLDTIAKAVAKAGHDTDNYKADDAVYETLPPCCHYRG